MSMQPLKIVWEFASPVAARTYPLHLDALLAWAMVNRAEMMGGHPCPYSEQDVLPLERSGEVWKASQLVFTPASEPYLLPFIRKASIVEFAADSGFRYEAGKKNKFSIGTGKYKAFDLRLHVQPMKGAVAWCVGDRGRIEDLLKDVTSLGKWHMKGQGRVKRCGHDLVMTVQECPKDEEENWRLRVLPKNSGLELAGVEYWPVMAVCSAPYWDRSRQQMAVMPANL